MTLEEKIKSNKWLFEQFAMINDTAMIIYKSMNYGKGLNFYNCALEYEKGVFGWTKENSCFNGAVLIYEQYTGNEAWDIINELDEILDDELCKITFEQVKEFEKIVSND